MVQKRPRLIALPQALYSEDPLPALLASPLPHGEPWGWLLARSLLGARELARRFLRSYPAGLLRIVDEDLQRLRLLRKALHEHDALSDLGCREAAPAEWAALEVLESGNAEDLAALYKKYGHSPYSCETAFSWDGSLETISRPDPVDLSELVGYEPQQKKLLGNVRRFLQGKPALPTLLYGARGTGKSTAVKALRTRFANEGLRLVEVLPEGLFTLPRLLDELRDLPQRFVLYIDDLAYDAGDRGWRKLKSMLDGAVWERPANVMLIATSNRKNIVRENWRDRPDPGAEPGAWDTLQERLALADRFGLHITFPPFDQQLYLRAVAHHLGKDDLDEKTRAAALRFALEGHGFSGRTAKQFAESLF